MKMTTEHLERLKKESFECLQSHKLHPFMVKNLGHAWDVVHKISATPWLYAAGYTDKHIDSALRVIYNIKTPRGA